MAHREIYLQHYFEYNQYLRRIRFLAAILVCLAIYSYMLILLSSRKRKRGITYAPMIDRDVERLRRLNRLYHGTEAHCISELHMRKSVFHRLCAELRSRALLDETFHVTIEEQLAMFLHVVGQNWSIRAIGFEFLRSTETVSRYFYLVLHALYILARDLIRIRTVETHSKITSSPGRFYPYFEGCRGALDGTHIPASVPSHMQDRFRGRKSFPSQNVLAAVDFDLRFVYVLAGWEGSAHDSYVLQDALARPSGLKILEGKYFLADAGYAARPDSNHADSDDSRDFIDLNCYAPCEDQTGYDSDTLPPSAINGNSEGTSNSNQKRRRCVKSLQDIIEGGTVTAPTGSQPQKQILTDLDATLWQRIQSIPLTPDQKVLIGEHLYAKENEGKRGWLTIVDDDTLNAWVLKFLYEKEGFYFNT